MRFYGLDKPGMAIGVVGLGGLGAHAVRIAKAMGCKVWGSEGEGGKCKVCRRKAGCGSDGKELPLQPVL